jgi:hypothetical protein
MQAGRHGVVGWFAVAARKEGPWGVDRKRNDATLSQVADVEIASVVPGDDRIEHSARGWRNTHFPGKGLNRHANIAWK